MATPRCSSRSLACMSTSTPLGRIMRPTNAAIGTLLRGLAAGREGVGVDSRPAKDGEARPRLDTAARAAPPDRRGSRPAGRRTACAAWTPSGAAPRRDKGAAAGRRRSPAGRAPSCARRRAATGTSLRARPPRTTGFIATRWTTSASSASRMRASAHAEAASRGGIARGAAEIEVDDARRPAPRSRRAARTIASPRPRRARPRAARRSEDGSATAQTSPR